MNYFRLLLPLLLLTLIVGCRSLSPEQVRPEDLPLLGHDPLMHTVYQGTDASYHHFAVQDGKSGRHILIPKAACAIKPMEVPYDTDSGSFVQSATRNEIQLLQFGAAGH